VKAEKKLQETIRNQDEIGHLAVSIDKMEDRIQNYNESITQITAEKERINTELALATRIQADMLPHVFPPFPDRNEFDLYAVMDPAKEVGGDFYDFFLIDDDHLGMVMADVSGKGVPAALFMMACKIILQSVAMLGGSPAEVLTRTNEAICSNNQEEMFITVWMGVLEISTGKLTAANAGHEYPVIMEADGLFELYRDKHGLVIGAMDGVKYREYELMLKPGTKLFVYTDGVPEATDADNELFGLNRMVTALNKVRNGTPEEILAGVKRDVNRFVKGAEQFDDVTMLCMEYKGNGGNDHE
jgi:sigma-B regulation protein RsbU (phosphoserine phosphatase)